MSSSASAASDKLKNPRCLVAKTNTCHEATSIFVNDEIKNLQCELRSTDNTSITISHVWICTQGSTTSNAYVVFRTANRTWWSVEQISRDVVIQRSTFKDAVVKRLRNVERIPSPTVRQDRPTTVNIDLNYLIDWLILYIDLSLKTHQVEENNSWNFANRLLDLIKLTPAQLEIIKSSLFLKNIIEKVMAAIKLWIPLRKEVLLALDKLAAHIEKVENDKNIARTATLPVAIVGGILIFGAGLASIFTAGLGTPLMFVAVGGTVAAVSGSAASGGTSLVCHFLEKRDVEKAQKIMDKDREGLDDIVQNLRKINEYYTKHNMSITAEGKRGIESAVSMAASALTNLSRLATPTLSAARAGGIAAEIAVVGTLRAVGVIASATLVVVDTVQLIFSIDNLVKGSPSEAAKKIRDAREKMTANFVQIKHIQAELISNLSLMLKEENVEY